MKKALLVFLVLGLALGAAACTRVHGTLMSDGSLVVDYLAILQNKNATVSRTADGLKVEYNVSNDPAVQLARTVSDLAKTTQKGAAP